MSNIKSSWHLAIVTVSACVLALFLCVFHATTETNYAMVFHALFFVQLAGLVGMFFHIACSFAGCLGAGQRPLQLWLAGIIAAVLFWAVPVSVDRHFRGLRCAFLQRRVQEYDGMVGKIRQNQRLLSASYTNVGYLVGRRFVMARTNADESLTIRFYGRVDGGRLDHKRVGYIYHDGVMIPHPDHPDYYTEPGFKAYDYHLTNGWYEF